ncbi:MAG: phytoene/squalene synthase family protein [Hyphomicrobiales bacterium]
MSTDAGRTEIWNFVRSHDADRYLSVLFAPRGLRDDLMTLYAFNAETVRIPGIASEPMLGEIRLQWWRDAIAAPGVATGNPVADALNGLAARHHLPRGLLTGMLDVRSFDLGDAPMPDMEALLTYLGKSEGAVFTLAARIVHQGPQPRGIETDRAGREAGIALGLARLLGDPARLMRFRPVDAAPGAAFPDRLHDRAQEAVDAVRTALAALPRSLLPVFLPVAAVSPALKAAQQAPAGEAVRVNPLARHWRFWRAAFRGRI